MPTRWNPACVLSVDGSPVATSAAAPGALLAVDEVTAPWGRDRLWNHQDTAQATFTLIDRTGAYGPNGGVALLRKPVTCAWSANGQTRVFFRGRITDVTLTVRDPDPVTGNFGGNLLEVTAASTLTEVAGVRTVSPLVAASMGVRWNSHLRSLIMPSIVANANFPPVSQSMPLAARTGKGEGVLELLRGLLDGADQAPRMIYDPDSNWITYIQRRVYAQSSSAALRADPVNSPDGGLLLGAPGSALPSLDAGEFHGSGRLVRSMENWISGVEVTHATDSTGSDTATAQLYSGDVAETVSGVNRMSLATDAYNSADWSGMASTWLSMMFNEGRRWHPDPLTHATRALGGLTWDVLRLCLDGVEKPGAVHVNGSPWVTTGAGPWFAVIGGTIRYADGWWSPDIQLAPVHYSSLSAAPVTAATAHDPAHPVTAATLSDAVSFADAKFWTTTYTG
jgi:hypothetical protein